LISRCGFERGADDEVERLSAADGVERRADLPAFVFDGMAGGAGEFGAAKDFRPALRVAVLAHFLHQRRHKLRRRPELAGGATGF
jgi:hypothetical protein